MSDDTEEMNEGLLKELNSFLSNDITTISKAPETGKIATIKQELEVKNEKFVEVEENEIEENIGEGDTRKKYELNNKNTLPDIVNVQATKEKDPNNTTDILIPSLTNNLNCLDLNSSKETNFLNVSSISDNDKGILSDEELFVDCQTFTEGTQHFDDNGFNNTQQKSINNIKNTSNNENRSNILSKVTLLTENHQKHSFDEYYINSTIQQNEFIESANDSTQEQINKVWTENSAKELQNISALENSESTTICDHVTGISELDGNKKINTLNYTFKEKNESSNECTKVIQNQFMVESLNTSANSDIYVPQVLLRQKEEIINCFNNQSLTVLQQSTINLENVNQTTDNDSQISNVPDFINKSIKSSDCSSDNCSIKNVKNSETCHKMSVDEMTIFSNSSKDSNMKYLEENNLNNSKILNAIIDNNIDINLNSNLCKNAAEFPTDIIFAANLEAINSTIKLELDSKSDNSINNSSFNNNGTVPIFEITDEILKTELPKGNNRMLSEVNSLNEIEKNNSLKEDNNNNEQFLYKANTSEEPMDIDVSISQSKTLHIEANNSSDPKSAEIEFSKINFDLCTENNKTEFVFEAPSIPPPHLTNIKNRKSLAVTDEDFHNQQGLILSEADFDFLLSKNNNCTSIIRDSLLLRFDPLLGHAIPVSQQQNQQRDKAILQKNCKIPSSNNNGRLSPIIGENEDVETANNANKISSIIQLPIKKSENNRKNNDSINLPFIDKLSDRFEASQEQTFESSLEKELPINIINKQINNFSHDTKNNVKMSLDVIHGIKIENNDVTNKSIDLSTRSEEKQDYKMEDLEKKMKNDVLKSEDIDKKLKEAEQREEALIKRITEKDKSIAKMSGVIEAYEKALAELIAEKEQIKQNYERQINELKVDRDSNYQHLLSLESTFSDLHVKYERSKQTTEKLRKSEEDLLAEKRKTSENLRLQEERYEKMKSHALQQLEIANNKLDMLSKSHAAEVTKLKALLKKEEISRLSIAEQLQQKARENEELMKICDELINGQGS